MKSQNKAASLKISSSRTGDFSKKYSEDITDKDREFYKDITSDKLTPEQKQAISQPTRVHPREECVLAIHWHPEHVPFDLIEERLNRSYPNRKDELIIPTQHNMILSYKGYCGVEVDCYSREFKRKVQLLLHFKEEKLKGADKLKSMIDHTFRYRSGQLFDFLDTLLDSRFEYRIVQAARETSADKDLIHFVRVHARKLKGMIDEYELQTPRIMLKNKIIREYIDKLREFHDGSLIDRAQIYLKAVKTIVKKHFNMDYFYETHQMIEEARSCGAGIVVPHPEQFWPILLADYDIDGYEVWNPQSQHYTEFLIGVVKRLNNNKPASAPSKLVMMGDDCHLGEKLKPKAFQDEAKAAREIGLQPAWDDLSIRKKLILYNIRKHTVIKEYRDRLNA